MGRVTRYRFVDGRYRVVHDKPRAKPKKPKPKPKARSRHREGVCPACGRTIAIIVPFGSRKLSYASHHRPYGNGPGTGGRCSMAMQPVDSWPRGEQILDSR